MVTVGELIHSLKKDDVLAKLKDLYQGPGEDPEGYEEVWEKLKGMQLQTTTITVYISQRQSFSNSNIYIDVSGKEPSEDQLYAIEFVPWPQWLTMEITVAPELEPMSDIEKLAHCLYEMTWAGYSQETIADELEIINDRVEEIKEMFPDENEGIIKN
jgi:hypothetical protein